MGSRIEHQTMTRLDQAKRVLSIEAEALRTAADRLGISFEQTVQAFLQCRGRIALTGIGKSADVALKVVGTLNSTGTRAYFLDATKALHGDLGMVHPDDLILIFSHSGESEELVRLLHHLQRLSSGIYSITGNAKSSLAQRSTSAIIYGPITESCPLQLAPSASATVMMSIGHALAFVLSEAKRFTREHFAQFHPAGSLGRLLANVDTYMRRGNDLRIAHQNQTVREVFTTVGYRGRRTGAIMLTDDLGKLVGIFTDSDLARLFERRNDSAIDQPISQVMTRSPITITAEANLSEALALVSERKISELPVLDDSQRPIGLLDITDLIGLFPRIEELIHEEAPLRKSA